MKSGIRQDVTKLTWWPCRSPLTGGLLLLLALLLLLSAVAAKGPETDQNRRSQLISTQEIHEAEHRLSILGYWTGPVDGRFDSGSRHALVAFQKVEGRRRTGKLTSEELGALRIAVTFLPQYTGYAHVEIDLQRQVLFVIDESDTVTRILPVCTGNEQFYVDHGQVHRAYTPRGQFKIRRKILGFRISSLGLLYYPNYIYEGIAIHGSWAMAVYPASHGCIRIPMFAAKEFSELVPLGTTVMIY
ncbi:MAG: L,D-transpeptidase family protein [Pyrinomonadaceae bacterium]|nr:L,D-transpeptidase family protein [Pyrinomonadaceae bacterium]